MTGLKAVPLRFRYFFTKESTFFGRKSAWEGTGESVNRLLRADFDRPLKATSTVKVTMDSSSETSGSSNALSFWRKGLLADRSNADLELLSEPEEELSLDVDVEYVRENLLRLLLDRLDEC